MDLKMYIREIPNFPKPGILFRDVTPLLQDSGAFKHVVERFSDHYENREIDVVLAIEARGFLFGAPLAYRLGRPLVPVRKRGKLPYKTRSVSYSLEYGSDAVEMHEDGVVAGQRVVIVDDLLATGGTMAATCSLVEKLGGRVEGLTFVIELTALGGRNLLSGYDILTLVKY